MSQTNVIPEKVCHKSPQLYAVMLQIIVPLLKVLVLMHEQHILHRDIKPENIFLSGKQKLKLGDLGLAIRSTEELPFTRSGTLDYMAPEVTDPLLLLGCTTLHFGIQQGCDT